MYLSGLLFMVQQFDCFEMYIAILGSAHIYLVQQFNCLAMSPFVITQALIDQEEFVFNQQSNTTLACPDCLAWWVCDHHWTQLWADVEDYVM